MRQFPVLLVILPWVILALMVPVFQSPAVANTDKGIVIGIYLALSIIGVLEMRKPSSPR